MELTANIQEGADALIQARIEDEAGTALPSSEIESVTGFLYLPRVHGDRWIERWDLDPADVWFDPVLLDAAWTQDEVGFNFRWQVEGSVFSRGGAAYKLEVRICTVSRGQIVYGGWLMTDSVLTDTRG